MADLDRPSRLGHFDTGRHRIARPGAPAADLKIAAGWGDGLLGKHATTRRGLLGLVATVMAFGVRGRSSSADSSPEAVVDTLVRHIIDLLQSGGLEDEEALERLAATIEEDTDLDRLGRLVLGRHWRSADEAQRAEYLELFRQLMLRKFVGHLGAYSGEPLEEGAELFVITGTRPIGESDAIVQSRVNPPDRPPLDVKWRLRPRDGDWVIIDLIVENVSLLVSQRSEFASVVERGGMESLLDEMRQRLDRSPS